MTTSIYLLTFKLCVICVGHALVCSVVVGTNQGGVMAYSIDVPSSKHRNSKSPILMPIGKTLITISSGLYVRLKCLILQKKNIMRRKTTVWCFVEFWIISIIF